MVRLNADEALGIRGQRLSEGGMVLVGRHAHDVVGRPAEHFSYRGIERPGRGNVVSHVRDDRWPFGELFKAAPQRGPLKSVDDGLNGNCKAPSLWRILTERVSERRRE